MQNLTITKFPGVIRAQFELSDRPEHAGPHLYLLTKCLEVLEPVSALSKKYNGYIVAPEPGQYLSRKPWKEDAKVYAYESADMNVFRDILEQSGWVERGRRSYII